MKLKAGYSGSDSMRDKAERVFREEMRGANTRSFKKGGAVKCPKCSVKPKTHPLSKEQQDLVLPKRIRTEKAEHLKRGVRALGRKKYALGGEVYERERFGLLPSRKRPHFEDELEIDSERPIRKSLKRGGKATVKKYAAGGIAKIRHKQATASGKPITRKTVKVR